MSDKSVEEVVQQRFRVLREFIKLEAAGGIILFIMALLALVIDNSPLHDYYQAIFKFPIVFQFGEWSLGKPLLLWINDGLMAIFFLLVGLEIKREMIQGELNSFSKAMLPGVAAIGGMVVPALIYVAFNYHDPVALHGWAIPAATDIAFSLGILALLGSRVPVSLKMFLTALAIFDDVGAIVIIAIFYTKNIAWYLLVIATLLAAVLFIMNRYRITRMLPYVVVGTVLWLVVLKSGVHATLAGILVALAIPIDDPKNPKHSPLRVLEHRLHPWVAFAILPLFAFANAGVSFAGITRAEVCGSVTFGIMAGLFIGKQLGIWGASMLAIKTGIARLPRNTTGWHVYGISLIAGVGFTMSLFIGTLAFSSAGGSFGAQVRIGVIAGSYLAGALGFVVLRIVCRRKGHFKDHATSHD